MYAFFKTIKTSARYGIKFTRNLIAGFTGLANESPSTTTIFISQSFGLLFLPLIVFIIKPLTKKLSTTKQKYLPIAFYMGLALGSAISSLLSAELFKVLPSGLGNIIAMLTLVTVVPLATIAIPYFIEKTGLLFGKKPTEKKVLTVDKSSYKLGVELGFTLGSSAGAFFEFVFPGFGLLAAGIGSAVGVMGGVVIATVAPQWLVNFSNKNTPQIATNYSRITKSIKIGALIGTSFGVIVGTFLLPGIGTTIGGLIGAGVGGGAAYVATVLVDKLGLRTPPFLMLLTTKSSLSKISLHAKVGVATLSLVGALLGTFLFPGIGTIAGAAIGALAGSALGALAGASMVLLAYKLNPNSAETSNTAENDDKVDLHKQIKVGCAIGIPIGTLVGAFLGSFIPGIGTALGGFIGGFIGGMIGITVPAIKHAIEQRQKVSLAAEKPIDPNLITQANCLTTKLNYQYRTALILSKLNSSQPTPNKKFALQPITTVTSRPEPNDNVVIIKPPIPAVVIPAKPLKNNYEDLRRRAPAP